MTNSDGIQIETKLVMFMFVPTIYSRAWLDIFIFMFGSKFSSRVRFVKTRQLFNEMASTYIGSSISKGLLTSLNIFITILRVCLLLSLSSSINIIVHVNEYILIWKFCRLDKKLKDSLLHFLVDIESAVVEISKFHI